MTNKNSREVEDVVAKTTLQIINTDLIDTDVTAWELQVENIIRKTLHQELQKAREEERERVIEHYRGQTHLGYEYLDCLETATETLYQSELDQPIS